MRDSYDDIINLPRHRSKTRPKMSLSNRAAQFSPFAALTGHDDAVKETSRLTEERIELDEYIRQVLNEKLQLIKNMIPHHPKVTITYFQPDEKKSGGSYLTIAGFVKRIDEFEKVIILDDGREIYLDEIYEIKIPEEYPNSF